MVSGQPLRTAHQLFGFTPDGSFVWGSSLDEYGTSRLTLYDADTGRVWARLPIEFEFNDRGE